MRSLHVLPMSAWVASGTPVSSRNLKMCTGGELVCPKHSSLSKCGVCVRTTLPWRAALSGVSSELAVQAPATLGPGLE